MKTLHITLTAAACGLLATPCIAQPTRIGADRYATTVHHADLRPATRGAAQRVFARLDAAALAVCGASAFSLREAVEAERRSPCWRDAMAGAMAQVDDPVLLQLYHRHSDREALP